MVPHLRYYFGILAKDYWDVMTNVHYGDQTRLENFSKEHCVVFPADVVAPTFSVAGRSGFTNPREYESFIKKLFGVSNRRNGDITHRVYIERGHQRFRQYILIGYERKVSSNIDAMLLELEQEFAKMDTKSGAAEKRAYLQWLNVYGSRRFEKGNTGAVIH